MYSFGLHLNIEAPLHENNPPQWQLRPPEEQCFMNMTRLNLSCWADWTSAHEPETIHRDPSQHSQISNDSLHHSTRSTGHPLDFHFPICQSFFGAMGGTHTPVLEQLKVIVLTKEGEETKNIQLSVLEINHCGFNFILEMAKQQKRKSIFSSCQTMRQESFREAWASVFVSIRIGQHSRHWGKSFTLYMAGKVTSCEAECVACLVF